jgi:hypothetical protein
LIQKCIYDFGSHLNTREFMSDPLEAIINFQMDDLEAKAYKISLMWSELSWKEFPNYQHMKIRRSGDPRKSLLFKHCYKLARETNGFLPDKEYKLYILAQLHILKSITDGKVHALIDPQCLHGEKAWRRWQVWKRRFDAHRGKTQSVENISSDQTSRTFLELEKTKLFLADRDCLNFEQYKEKVLNRTIIKWITFGWISPIYSMISPWMKKSLNKSIEEAYSFDFSIYRKNLNDEVLLKFKELFPHEC